MNDQDTTLNEPDDAEGHRLRQGADAESAEGVDDTEGHWRRPGGADAESAEGDDDTEGHWRRPGGADAESAEGDDDTEGHWIGVLKA